MSGKAKAMEEHLAGEIRGGKTPEGGRGHPDWEEWSQEQALPSSHHRSTEMAIFFTRWKKANMHCPTAIGVTSV